MKPKQILVCPDCGVEMNRHAAKIVEPRSMEEARQANRDLGGIVEHIHACPGCGKTVSQR